MKDKVLVLDDRVELATMLNIYLDKFEIDTKLDLAFNIEQALNLFDSNDYLFMIVDHKLLGGCGLDFISRLKNSGKLDIPWIYTTFYLDDALSKSVVSLGGVPVDKNDLLDDPQIIERIFRSYTENAKAC